MRLVSTMHGVGRIEADGSVAVLDLPYFDIGQLLLDGALARSRTAPVRSRLAAEDVTLLAPVQRPNTLVLAGLLYRSHCAEVGVDPPAEPRFMVFGGRKLDPPHCRIRVDGLDCDLDYEGEIALAIGDDLYRALPGDVMRAIAGVFVVNDVSDRRTQTAAMAALPWDEELFQAAKFRPTWKPSGPCLVTLDELSNPEDLRIRTRVNGMVRQDDRTSNMLFGWTEILAAITATTRLQPGDVVFTGTPAGCGLATGTFLSPGDVVEVEVDQVGMISSKVSMSSEGEA